MFAGLGVLGVGHQRHLAVVVDEADPGQPLVRDALAELQGLEVAQVDACSESVSWNCTISGSSSGRIGRIVTACRPSSSRRDVLRRDRGGWRAWAAGLRVDIRPVQDHPRVQRDQPSGAASSGLMSISLIQRLFGHQLAEAHQQLLQRGQIDRRAARGPPASA